MKVRFWVDGKPIPKARPRVVLGRRVWAYTPRETTAWEEAVRLEAHKALGGAVIDRNVPLRVRLLFYLPMPRRPRWALPLGRPDLDNLQKAVLDGLHPYVDDAQVVEVVAQKRWAEGEKEGVEVVVEEWSNAN